MLQIGGHESSSHENAADIQLPQAAELRTIAGIQINSEDVGHALQFLEFCAAFGQVLNLNKEEAKHIVRELICGRTRSRRQFYPIVQIHIKLLSFIQEDVGEKSWFQALRKCVYKSKCPLNDIPSYCLDGQEDGYYMLDGSKKLQLLNFLCDEALSTKALRSWIDTQNSKFVERGKEARKRSAAAKKKEIQLKHKLQDEEAKAKNGGPLLVAVHEAIISQIKRKAAQVHSEMLEATATIPRKSQTCDAVRTEPILVDDNGHVFWRLNGYAGESDILLQELQGNQDALELDEKWFVYYTDQKPAIEKYIWTRTKASGPIIGRQTHKMFEGNALQLE